MRVQSINSLVLNQNATKLKAATGVLSNPMQTNTGAPDLKTVSANQILSQMPNVSFKGPVHDDMSEYDNYDGPKPPAIEQRKYEISLKVHDDIENGRYVSAIGGKIALAEICHRQGKDDDAFMLEQGIKSLYKEIPDKADKLTAKILIKNFNYEMAEYLDEE